MALLLTHLPAHISAYVFLFSDGSFAQRLREASLPVTIVPVSEAVSNSTREQPTVKGVLEVPTVAWKLAALFRENDIDVVHAHTVKAHFIGGIAARFAGLPFVTHWRDILEGRARLAMRLLSQACATERIALSHAVSNTYDLPPTNIIYEPIDVAAYRDVPSKRGARERLGLPQDAQVVGIIGRINRWKGHDRFLRIAARVRETVSAHFAIIGAPVFRDADFVDELHRMVRELGLEGSVTFIPWMNDVLDAYASMDVHCNCSTREPLGRTILEAAACGVPSVCFDDGGAPEAIPSPESGVAIPPGDEAAFAGAVTAYLTDPAKYAAASAAGLIAVNAYDVSVHVQQVADVYQRATTV